MWGRKVRGLHHPNGEANDAFLDSLQKPLDQAERDLYQAKLESFLDTAEGPWLEYWGSWLGLHRLNGWGDDHYRQALKDHVLHTRNTITALRKEIASFLKTNIENVYIYEPYRDMFIWNADRWNTYKFYPSTYYRYAVIDVQLDAPYNKVVNEIINLFRPAGVMWVITSLVNSINENAPIIDFTADTDDFHFITEYIEYAGVLKRESYHITPNISKNWDIQDPFIYNDSLLNGGKEYYALSRVINGVSFLGKPTNGSKVEPKKDWDYVTAYKSVDSLSAMEANRLSNSDGYGIDYKFNEIYKSYNLLEKSKAFGFPREDYEMSGVTVFNNDGTTSIKYSLNNKQINEASLLQGSYKIPYLDTEYLAWQHIDTLVNLSPGTYVMKFQSRALDGSTTKHVRVRVYCPDDDTVAPGCDFGGNAFDLTDKVQYFTFTIPNDGKYYRLFLYNGTCDDNTGDANKTVEFYNVRLMLMTGRYNNFGPYVQPDYINKKLQKGKTYVFSADIRGKNTQLVNFQRENIATAESSVQLPVNLTDNWKRVYIKLDLTDPNIGGAFVIYAQWTGQGDDFSFEVRNVKLAEASTDLQADTSWSPTKEEANRATLMGIVDFYNYFLTDTASGNSKVDEVLKHVDDAPIKNLTIRMKQDTINPTLVKAYLYDFNVDTWVQQNDFKLINQYQSCHLPLVSLAPYLNDNGLFFVKLEPTDPTITLTVDYYGFSYGSNKYGVVDCYMPAQDGYGAWIKNIDVPISQLKIARVDQSHVGEGRLKDLVGISTIITKDDLRLSGSHSLGTITPSMENDLFFIDFDYKFDDPANLSNITLDILDVKNTRHNLVVLSDYTKYGSTGHISKQLPRIYGPSELTLSTTAPGEATKVTITQKTQQIGNYGKNLLSGSDTLACISSYNGTTLDKNNTTDDLEVPIDNLKRQVAILTGRPGSAKISLANSYNEPVTLSLSLILDGSLTSVDSGNEIHNINYTSNEIDNRYFKRYEIPFNKTSNEIKINFNGTLTLMEPKLEYGGISTPYTK